MLRGLRSVVGGNLVLWLAGCTGWQSALDPKGHEADALYRLILAIVATCTVIWVLVTLALVVALWPRRRVVSGPPLIDLGAERGKTIIVTGAVAVTAFIIIVFTIASYLATRALGSHEPELTIKVEGRQWWWEISYPASNSGKGFTTANEIHIPVRRDVRIELESPDVIHSFWVPNLAGKQDLVPGRSNALTIRADYPGLYRGQCAEFCGMQHAHMAFIVVAEDPATFESWARLERQDAVASLDEESRAGQMAFEAKACAACHTVRGTAAQGTNGPDLTHVGGRRFIAAGLVETTRGSLAAWIADPQTLKPGSNMPQVPLSADELRAISVYMASLK